MSDEGLYPILRELAYAPRPEGFRFAAGERVGRFEILREIDRGSFGFVYEARDGELGRHVAIKVLRFRLVTEERTEDAMLARLKHEAEAVARLAHPNIVTLHDFGAHAGLPFLVFELLHGETLRRRLAAGKLALSDALDIAAQIARGLAHAHEATVVHGDLNPNNIFVLPDGRVKLLDFGLARLREPLGDRHGDALTAAGTPSYMAPEQWRGEPVSAASDVFSAGVVVHEMIAGSVPFAIGQDGDGSASARFEHEAPALVDVPERIAALVGKALRRAASERFDDASRFLEAITDAQRALDEPLTGGDPYRYLEAFQEADRHWFFGRAAETARLAAMLASRPVVCVLGASGAGKSSLVHAGLVPRLRREGWAIITVRPGGEPLCALREQVQRHCDDAAIAERLAPIATRPAALGAVLRDHVRRTDTGVVVVVDQLEELYIRGASAEERAAFASAILLAADDPDGRIRVVLTLREDQVSRLSETPALRDEISQSLLLLGPPDAGGLLEALVGPARRLGYGFETGLAEDIVQALASEPAPLPLLQLTASRLWETRVPGERVLSRIGFGRLRGVTGIIATHAEEVFRKLDPAEQRIARELLLALVSLQRTASAEDRTQLLGRFADRAPSAGVLEALIRGRLVVASPSPDGARDQIRLAHESIIGGWDRLDDWLEEVRGERMQRERLARTAAQWIADGRPPEALWSGRRLRDELGRAGHYAEPLSPHERDFLAAARTRRRARSIRMLLASLAGVVAITAITWQVISARRAGEHRAVEAESLARASSIASAAASSPDPLVAALLLAELVDTAEPPGGLRNARRIAEQPIPEHVLRGHVGPVFDVAYDPRGDRVITASHDGRVLAWRDDGTGAPVELHANAGSVTAIDASPDGTLVAAGFENAAVRLLRSDGSAPAVELAGHTGSISQVGFSADGGQLATASADGTARLWRIETRRAIVLAGKSPIRAVGFDRGGERVATGSQDGTIAIWKIEGAVELATLRGHDGPVTSIAFDGERVLSASEDATARIWRVDGSAAPIILRGHGGAVRSARFSRNGRAVLTGSDDKTARRWAADGSSDAALVLRGHGEAVTRAIASPSGDHIATASRDGTVRIWPARGARQPLQLGMPAAESRIVDAKWNERGDQVATQNTDGTVGVFRLGDPQPIVQRGANGLIYDVFFSPDDRHVLAIAAPGEALLWPADRSTTPVRFTGHQGDIVRATFDRTGTRLATASVDRTARLWWVDGRAAPTVLAHAGPVNDVVFSHDGTRLATASVDGAARIWRVDGDGAPVMLRAEAGSVRAVGWNPAGTRIVSGHEDGTFRVWDLARPDAPRVFRGHGAVVRTAKFSADGTRIITSSSDRTARVWHVDGGHPPVVFTGHDGTVFNADLDPDAELAISSSADHTVRIWRTTGLGEAEVLQGHLGYLSPDTSLVVTSSKDGIARVWIRTWRELVHHLGAATTACLTVEQRQRFLVESHDEAVARAGACERRHGRTPLVVQVTNDLLAADAQHHPDIEPDTEYEGASYRNFELPDGSSRACRQACVDDARCRTFTLLDAGVFGPKAVCYLKAVTPKRRFNAECTGGRVR